MTDPPRGNPGLQTKAGIRGQGGGQTLKPVTESRRSPQRPGPIREQQNQGRTAAAPGSSLLIITLLIGIDPAPAAVPGSVQAVPASFTAWFCPGSNLTQRSNIIFILFFHLGCVED